MAAWRLAALGALLLCVYVAIAEARAGEFGLATWNAAPAAIIEGQRGVLLRIAATNPGAPGSPEVELTSLGLRLESTEGTALASAAAGNLLSAIELYADTNASGGFEPESDTLIATLIAPTPAADGTISLTFDDTDPADVRIGAGQSRNYFVVVRFTADASAQIPRTLRLTHLTTGVASSTAHEAVSGAPLTLQPVADVSATTVTAIFNTAPTTGGIANVISFDPATPVNIALASAFSDAEDAPGRLQYDITSISNPALFAFAGIDPFTGVLALDYKAGVTGSSEFTIRATDSAGKTVSTTSSITLAPMSSYADWAAFQFRAGNVAGTAAGDDRAGMGVSNFAKYAFALDPNKAGDCAGLPRLEKNGSALLFTHLKPKYATDLAYSYEISSDLVTWQPATNGVHFYENAKDLSDGRTRVDLLLLVNWPTAFLRARAQALLGTYPDWAAFHFGGGNPEGSAAGDDPTGTGATNLAKYAFAVDPHNASDRAGLPRLDKIGSGWVFTHLKPKYAADLAYSYEISSDLATWATATDGVHFQQSTKDLSDGRVRVDLLLLVDWPKAFLRARTEQIVGAVQTPGGGLDAVPFTAAPMPAPPLVEAPAASAAGGVAHSGMGQPIHGTAIFSQETVLTTAAGFANSVAIADLDGDGIPDVLSVSLTDNKVAWYRNNGDGTFGPQQVISTASLAPSAVAAADLDGDGKLDVITGSELPFPHGTLAWHRNLGGGVFGPQQVISTDYAFITSIAVADLDGDGKPDILCTSLFDNQIAWHKNLGGGAFGPNQVIGVLSGSTAAIGPYQAVIADLDGDGKPDIISASSTDNKIAWYRNNGDGTFGVQQVISTSPTRASTVAAADFDGDGRIDVICGAANENTVSYFRNNGNGTFGPRVILSSDARGVFSVIAADLNGDGAPDVVSASLSAGKIAWHENLGDGTFGPEQIISTNASGAVSVAAADLNGDGTVDVVSASQSDSKVAAYLNGGSQAAIATTDTAPSGLVEGTRGSLLRIAFTNRGRPGDNSARLATLTLLFESSAGVPLTTVQANNLIDSVQIYADMNGSGVFEPASDRLVQTILFLPLNGGVLHVPLPTGSPCLPVLPGATRNFFVVVTMQPEAASQALHTFRVTSLTTGPARAVAKDACSGALVALEPVASTVSSFVTAQPNQAPVTRGIPPITVFDTIAPTSVPLREFFNDAEDGAAGLKYAITANNNPALFAFAGITTANGVLLLKYRPGTGGSAQLTVRATDTLGKSVSTIVGVNVQVITSMADWTNRYGGGTPAVPPGTVANLLSYAFALNPTASGFADGLPRIYSVGRARVLSHLKPRYATDLTYNIEISSDLLTWSPAILGTHYYDFITDLPNAFQRRDAVILVDWPQVFLRVRTGLIP